MQILLIFSFIIAFLAILFAIQNTDIVSISFLFWETQGSLALILFIAMVTGALISYLATAPGQIKQRLKISNQGKRISELENQLTKSQDDLMQANTRLDQLRGEMQAEPQPGTEGAQDMDVPTGSAPEG